MYAQKCLWPTNVMLAEWIDFWYAECTVLSICILCSIVVINSLFILEIFEYMKKKLDPFRVRVCVRSDGLFPRFSWHIHGRNGGKNLIFNILFPVSYLSKARDLKYFPFLLIFSMIWIPTNWKSIVMAKLLPMTFPIYGHNVRIWQYVPLSILYLV